MKKLELLIAVVESFLYEMMNVYDVNIKVNEDENETMIFINYALQRHGQIKKYCTHYSFINDDLECEFAYVVSMALYDIGAKVSSDMACNYIIYKHNKGVI